MSAIVTLDLRHFTQGTPQQKAQFVHDLGQAYEEIGFVAIKGHSLSDDLQERLYSSIQRFFALPDDVKAQYEIPGGGGQRGYTGKGKEHAKNSNTGDLKEFYHVGQEVTDNDPIKAQYPDNVWPTEHVSDFQEVTWATYQALENDGRQMLRAIALFLGLDEFYFDSRIHNGNSILRPIHYFPITEPDAIPADAVRSAEHEDINMITLLMGASAEGLQLLNRQGEWVPVTALPESLVVNVGDMLQRLTNNRLRSTTHRVVLPPRELMHLPRYSVPFFLHARPEVDLTCLPSCVTADNPLHYPPITAGQYLYERLVEIGLIRPVS